MMENEYSACHDFPEIIRAIKKSISSVAMTVSRLGFPFADSFSDAHALFEGYVLHKTDLAVAARARGFGLIVENVVGQLEKINPQNISFDIDYDRAFYEASWKMPDFPRFASPKRDMKVSFFDGTVDMIFSMYADNISKSYFYPISYIVCLGELASHRIVPFVLSATAAKEWKKILGNNNKNALKELIVANLHPEDRSVFGVRCNFTKGECHACP